MAISAAPDPAVTVAGDTGSRVSTAQGGRLCAHWWQSLGLPWCLLARIKPGKHLASSHLAFRDQGGGGTLLLGSGAPKERSKDPGYETFSFSGALEWPSLLTLGLPDSSCHAPWAARSCFSF